MSRHRAGPRHHWRRVAAAVAAAALALAPAATIPGSNAVFTDTRTNNAGFTADVLAAPTNLQVSASGSSIVLTWGATPSAYADGYKVYRSAAASGPWTEVGTVSGRTTTTWTDTAPPAGTSYYLVRAYRVNWLSGTTDVGDATTAIEYTLAFNYTGAAQTWVVPSGVTSITVDAYGAQGGNGAGRNNNAGQPVAGGNGAAGGHVTGRLAVTPGETLHLYVGGRGNDGFETSTDQPGGWNGGGDAPGAAGSGGGATDIRRAGTALTNRVLVAGGGGGGGAAAYFGSGNRGAGGGGLTGATYGSKGGLGGTQTAAGAAGNGGSAGTGSTGGKGAMLYSNPGGGLVGGQGGGGGGGWYGGGGGGYEDNTGGYGGYGGGGGSSWYGSLTSAATTAGVRAGHGRILITYYRALSAPAAPTAVSASVSGTTGTVSFTAPADNGGSPITSYTVTVDTGQTATGTGSPISVPGLAFGTRTFRVTATNAIGTSVPSSPATASVAVAFGYTGATQTWTVPTGVTQLRVEAWGAQGGGTKGGNGGYSGGFLTVSPGQVLTIAVGGRGGNPRNNPNGGPAGAPNGGWNGGGSGGSGHGNGSSGMAKQAGGGGGATTVRRSGTLLMVAAGGGGEGHGFDWNSTYPGGGGAGGQTGGAGTRSSSPSAASNPGQGGTATGGGAAGASDTQWGTWYLATAGSSLQGGAGAAGYNQTSYNPGAGGGGGGGYYGGGGGGGDREYNTGSGGGGGSSWVSGTLTSPSYQTGTQAGDGRLVLSVP